MKLIESYFWGIIAALGALISEIAVYMGISIYANSISTVTFFGMFSSVQFIIFAALIEEVLKYIAIYGRNETISEKRSLMLNSFLIGLGFFSIEFLLLSASRSGITLRILLEIAVVHIGTAGLIGYIISTEKSKKIPAFLSAIALATIFHGMYNLLSGSRNEIGNYVVFAVLGLLIFTNLAAFFSKSRSLA